MSALVVKCAAAYEVYLISKGSEVVATVRAKREVAEAMRAAAEPFFAAQVQA